MPDKLVIKYVAIDSLEATPGNPRFRNVKAKQAIADSIQRYGFRVPVVVRGKSIVAGHGRVDAARHLGITKVPTVSADDLSESEARAFLLADNRTTDLSEFLDDGLLPMLDAALEDDGTLPAGWDDTDMEALRALVEDDDEVIDDSDTPHEHAGADPTDVIELTVRCQRQHAAAARTKIRAIIEDLHGGTAPE